MKSSSDIYYKGSESAVVGDKFIYESSVYTYFKNYVFLTNSAIYESDVPIKIVESTFVSKHVEIRCELKQAPLDWLIENGFEIWKPKPKKKRKVKNGK